MDKEFIDNPVEAYEKLKAENERLKEEIKEVKKYQYEQEYLKEEIEIRDNISEKFRKEALSWANIANGYQKDKTKLKQTLQEIKAIAEKTIDIYYPDYYDEGFEEDIVTEFAKQVLDLITKAESEGSNV